MNFEDMVKDALYTLTNDGTFHIDLISYDEKHFGNVLIVLSSNNRVDIRFINDRGIFSCDVGQAGEWFFIEDLFAVIGVTFAVNSDDLIDFIARMAYFIKSIIPQIFQAFNTENYNDTLIKIKAIENKRVMDMFGLNLTD